MIKYSLRAGVAPGAAGLWAVERSIDGLAPVHMATCHTETDAREIVAALSERAGDRRAAAALSEALNSGDGVYRP